MRVSSYIKVEKKSAYRIRARYAVVCMSFDSLAPSLYRRLRINMLTLVCLRGGLVGAITSLLIACDLLVGGVSTRAPSATI